MKLFKLNNLEYKIVTNSKKKKKKPCTYKLKSFLYMKTYFLERDFSRHQL